MEIVIRKATEQDAGAIALLLTELGYPQDSDEVRSKLEELQEYKTFLTLVAEYKHDVEGVIAFDMQPLLHQPGEIGTIMALVVSHAFRGHGIGRALVEHVEKVATEAGCIRIAVASGMHREDAHRFYRALGYEEITKRFVKSLNA